MNEPIVPQYVAQKPVQAQDSLGSIAVSLPGATAIFRRLKLDFCCGGHVALAEATANKRLDTTAVLAELNALHHRESAPTEAAAPELIAHILERFHSVHKRELPELVRMARRVEAVHRDHPDVPDGLADHLETMEQELLSHMAKEEQVLFPMMQQGHGVLVRQPIQMMRLEHVDHGLNLEALMQLAHDGVPPDGACNTWRALYSGVIKLQDDLINHIHLENNVLFVQFEAMSTLAPETSCGGNVACGCSH